MLIIAPSLLPIFGSGVDIGADIGGVSASDIDPIGISSVPEAGGGVGIEAPAERLPRISSLNFSSGTLITNSFGRVCTIYKRFVNSGGYLASNRQMMCCFKQPEVFLQLLARLTTFTIFTHNALLHEGGHLLYRGSSHTLLSPLRAILTDESYDRVLPFCT